MPRGLPGQTITVWEQLEKMRRQMSCQLHTTAPMSFNTFALLLTPLMLNPFSVNNR